MLTLPGLSEGSDVYDWLSTRGGTAEKLWALVEAPDRARTNGPVSPQQAPSGLVMVRAADVSPVAIDWIWDGRIARGKLTIICWGARCREVSDWSLYRRSHHQARALAYWRASTAR